MSPKEKFRCFEIVNLGQTCIFTLVLVRVNIVSYMLSNKLHLLT